MAFSCNKTQSTWVNITITLINYFDSITYGKYAPLFIVYLLIFTLFLLLVL